MKSIKNFCWCIQDYKNQKHICLTSDQRSKQGEFFRVWMHEGLQEDYKKPDRKM